MNKQETDPYPVFQDPQILIEVWKKRHDSLDSQGRMIWNSVYYLFLLLVALISAYLVALGMILDLQDALTQFYASFGLYLLPMLIILISFEGIGVARRRFKRILEYIAQVCKIESLLGLNEDISQVLRRMDTFPEDKYLFQRFVDTRRKYKTENDFVLGELDRPLQGRNTFTDIRNVY